MADTVVSMARSMLGGAISAATSAATAEMGLLMGVRKDIWFIKDELETIQAFLVAAQEMKKKDMLLKVWAKQVRDLSYGIEDCLAEFMVHVRSQSLSRQLIKLKDRHRIAIQIRDLKSRVEEVSNRNARYNLIKTDTSSTTDELGSYMEDVRNHSASNVDEAELVGFAKPKKELIKLMDVHDKQDLVKVICVVGMGGLGKTTLARKTYESKEDIMKHFSCCAWITVSQSFFKIEMLKDMIKQLLGGESLKNCLKELEGKAMQVDDLAKHLTTELKDKRYFIVLDDLWAVEAWMWIKDIVCPSSNNKGSRIIVTTRDIGLAEQCTTKSLIYHLELLQIDDAIKLLLRKSRRTLKDIENDVKMRTVVTKIIQKCGRLPLAVLTIGGMLASKIVTEWESIYMQIPLELESNPTLEAVRRVVTLSYNQLPSHLKSCFLYFSIFPEDSEIKRSRLVERWIAEGFVRARSGISMEDVGKNYFNELINRSMILPSKVSIEGIVKSCRVHDIMRDVMISIAREENFVYLVGDSVTSVEENIRHVAYHGNTCQDMGTNWRNVRSLTLFGGRLMELSPSLCLSDMRMLRALDLRNALFTISQQDINNIGSMRHLKYVDLGSRYCDSTIYKLPRSIGKLQELQNLDIGRTCITKLPTEIGRLKSLRILRCHKERYYHHVDIDEPIKCFVYSVCWPAMFIPLVHLYNRDEVIAELHMAYSSCWSGSPGVSVPRGIGNLKELQILETVDIKQTSCNAIKELGKLTQLKKLCVVTSGASRKKCRIFCAAIDKLSSLYSLDVTGWGSGDGKLEWLDSVCSPPPLLRTLKLEGYLGEIPNWVGNLMHLVKIYLRNCKIKDEGKSMEMLGALPNLMLLGLDWSFYAAEKVVFVDGAFPNLRELEIRGWRRLSEMRFEEGTSPQMEKIQISFGSRLSSGVIGIKHLPRLMEISLEYDAKVGNLGVLEGEMKAHPNHPVLRLQRDRSEHDLGGDADVQGSNAAQVELVTGESSLPEPTSDSEEEDLR